MVCDRRSVIGALPSFIIRPNRKIAQPPIEDGSWAWYAGERLISRRLGLMHYGAFLLHRIALP